MSEQYVCTVCGYNMVGHHPLYCPFCGAPQEKFITAEECSEKYRVEGKNIAPGITQLRSQPRLGYEHAAYRVEAEGKIFWIDCPSCFDNSLEAVDVITFTHHHFLGASNMYRSYFDAEVQINGRDSSNEIARRFPFDNRFRGDFTEAGLEAFHVNGHTQGFTIYVFNDVLFVCDYVFLKPGGMIFNPYGPPEETRQGAESINKIAGSRNISLVCGYNYVENYPQWQEIFTRLL